MATAGLDIAKWSQAIDGDKEIARHCTEYAGVEVSVDQVRRLRRRDHDPLPAERIGQGKRPRWAIKKMRLHIFAAWLRREFGE